MTRDELVKLAQQYGKDVTVSESICYKNGEVHYHTFSLLIDGEALNCSAKSWQECADELGAFDAYRKKMAAKLRAQLAELGES